MYFIVLCLGPVSSILSVKYSYKTVTLLGGSFAAAGMIISFFAQSVGYLSFRYDLRYLNYRIICDKSD